MGDSVAEAPCSSGASRRATASRPTRRSWRSRPTRSTRRFPHWLRGRSSRSMPRPATRCRWAPCWPRSRPTGAAPPTGPPAARPATPVSTESPPASHEAALAAAAIEAEGAAPPLATTGETIDIVTPARRRVGQRGNDACVVGQGRRRGPRGRHGRGDLDRQGRHGAAGPCAGNDHRDPRAGGRDGHRGSGDRADGAASCAIGGTRRAVHRAEPVCGARIRTRRRTSRTRSRRGAGRTRSRGARGGSRSTPARARPVAPPPAPGITPLRGGAVARRRSSATWSRAARSPPPPPSARSSSPRSSGVGPSSRPPASPSPIRT